MWLAQVRSERLDEIADPEKARVGVYDRLQRGKILPERTGRNAQAKSMARPDGQSVYVTLPADRKTPSFAFAEGGVF